jgi:hypothetical protein
MDRVDPRRVYPNQFRYTAKLAGYPKYFGYKLLYEIDFGTI